MSKGNWFQEVFGSLREALVERGWFDQSERRDPGSWTERFWGGASDREPDIGGSVLDTLGPEHFAPLPDWARAPEPDHDLER